MSSTYSTSTSTTNTSSSTRGGSTSTTKTVSGASGKVSDTTQANFNKYNKDYVQGTSVTDAYTQLQNTLANKPQDFTSPYTAQLNNIYDKIMNRDKFSYDMNADALYNNYKQQYTQAGKTAMQDTMGQAAALTGGYGSSYAQSVGQQTYNNYLQQLNSIVPELYDRARASYDSDTQMLQNQYGLAKDAYSRDYGEYRDRVSDWQNDRTYATGVYQNERDYDYNRFNGERNYWNSEYWKERNSEQTSTSRTDTSTWSDTNSTSTTTSSSSSSTSSGGGGGAGGGGGGANDSGIVWRLSTTDATKNASGSGLTFPKTNYYATGAKK